ncbi:hypothetical protein HN51_047722, partial [Arachis hypogaea]
KVGLPLLGRVQGFIASGSTVCVARSTAIARIRRASVLLQSPHSLWPSIEALILMKRKALDCTDTQNHYLYNNEVAALVTKGELDGEMGDAHMAMQARLMSQALRKLNRSLSAIEDSRISIVVFSRSYGDSTWWLKELEKITECWSSKGQKVAPVFYVVDLSEAGAAFACRESLKKDACLPGFVTLNRLSKEVVDARHQCLKCAMDLSMKHEYLPEDLQIASAKC